MGASFWLLTLAQGLFTLNNVVLLAINALVGLSLAPAPGLATLPVAATIAGSALSMGAVARLHRRVGRRRAFQAGLLLGVLGYGLCALAVRRGSFGLLLLGGVLTGFYGANAGLYRFAAAELVEAPRRERALSLVLVGGLLGAFFGPGLVKASQGLAGLPYAGAYAVLSALALATLLLFQLIRFPPMDGGAAGAAAGRRARELARQPAFVAAVLAASGAFGVMSLLMNATPIAMRQHHHGLHAGALVLEWHVIAMFAPSLFSGRLIRRFGPGAMIGAGLACMLACVALALGGVGLESFFAALIALGLGWNFLYTGASALLLRTYAPHEKTTAQAAMDFWVYTALTLSSLASGWLVTGPGWTALNQVALAVLLLLGAALAWAWRSGRPG